MYYQQNAGIKIRHDVDVHAVSRPNWLITHSSHSLRTFIIIVVIVEIVVIIDGKWDGNEERKRGRYSIRWVSEYVRGVNAV